MSEHRQPNPDPLEEAIRAFQGMTVPEPPADAEVLARLGLCQGDRSPRSRTPIPPKRSSVMRFVAAAAAAVVLVGALALFLREGSRPGSVRVAATGSSDKTGDIAVRPEPGSAGRERPLREGLGRFDQHVAAAQVVVVATALDSAPAPPRRPGDLPEVLLRFQVKRVLKGTLADQVITTRTSTAAGEFIGKDWVLLLSPDYMAGKYQYAECVTVTMEPTVKAILSRDKK
jgi:hypothetical protein